MQTNSLKPLRSILFAAGAASALLAAGAARADNGYVDGNGVWYPYCTNSADNGGGFGWQPELGGPNGGSCKINYGSNNGGANFPSGTWYDGNGVAYPYCTNSADNGGGFGWQPELGGPNGGSCRINYGGNGGNGGGYNGGNGGGYNGGNGGGYGGGYNHDGGYHRGGPVGVHVGHGGVGVHAGPVGVHVGPGGIHIGIGHRLDTENATTVED